MGADVDELTTSS